MSFLSRAYSKHITETNSNEGPVHWEAKMDLFAFLDGQDALCSFSYYKRTLWLRPRSYKGRDNTKWAFVPDYVAPEVAWPGAEELGNVEEYRKEHGRLPDFVFDIGIFSCGKLVGGIEVARSHPLAWQKVRKVTDAGLWVVEVRAEAIHKAIHMSSCHDTLSLDASKFITPECPDYEREAP